MTARQFCELGIALAILRDPEVCYDAELYDHYTEKARRLMLAGREVAPCEE